MVGRTQIAGRAIQRGGALGIAAQGLAHPGGGPQRGGRGAGSRLLGHLLHAVDQLLLVTGAYAPQPAPHAVTTITIASGLVRFDLGGHRADDLALVASRSSRLMPGLRGMPAVITTTSLAAVSS